MALTFFWLVMGELIILHQKAIYGFDPFEQETPFTKTDNTKSKAKSDKGLKLYKFKDKVDIVALVSRDQCLIKRNRPNEVLFTNTYSIFVSLSGYPLIVLRGPPLL
jgi:hypothetical protein